MDTLVVLKFSAVEHNTSYKICVANIYISHDASLSSHANVALKWHVVLANSHADHN